MPDQYGFDHLGREVACVECFVRGPVYEWPEELREEHSRLHESEVLERKKLSLDEVDQITERIWGENEVISPKKQKEEPVPVPRKLDLNRPFHLG